MSLRLNKLLESPVIRHISIESTNKYAMTLTDADKTQEGTTIVTETQTGGRGQRLNTWTDDPGNNILMSLILSPGLPYYRQFQFNMCIAVAVAGIIKQRYRDLAVYIKWPNDIIINDKKAGGILIENIWKAQEWKYAIIGLGLNVNQRHFPEQLKNAGSLYLATGLESDLNLLFQEIRKSIFQGFVELIDGRFSEQSFQQMLYKRNQQNSFLLNGKVIQAKVLGVNTEGELVLLHANGTTAAYAHGSIEWLWPEK